MESTKDTQEKTIYLLGDHKEFKPFIWGTDECNERIKKNDITIYLPCEMGNNVTIANGVILGENCKIGDNVNLGYNVLVDNDCIIENEVTLNNNVTVSSHILVRSGANVNDGEWDKIEEKVEGYVYKPLMMGDRALNLNKLKSPLELELFKNEALIENLQEKYARLREEQSGGYLFKGGDDESTQKKMDKYSNARNLINDFNTDLVSGKISLAGKEHKAVEIIYNTVGMMEGLEYLEKYGLNINDDLKQKLISENRNYILSLEDFQFDLYKDGENLKVEENDFIIKGLNQINANIVSGAYQVKDGDTTDKIVDGLIEQFNIDKSKTYENELQLPNVEYQNINPIQSELKSIINNLKQTKMANQFEGEKYLKDVESITNQFAKLGLNISEITKQLGSLLPTDAIKELLKGKRTDLIEIEQKGEDNEMQAVKGKYQVIYINNEPELKFIERRETLQLTEGQQKYLTEADITNLNKYGNANRVINVNPEGEATLKYISLDRETNTLATMSAAKINVRDNLLGASLSEEQQQSIKEGKATLVQGLTNNRTGEKYDALVTVDALNKGFSIKKIDETKLGREIFGVELNEAQKTDLAAGKTIYLRDCESKGKVFDSFVTSVNDKLDFKIINVPKHLLGVQITPAQQEDLRNLKTIKVAGLTNKEGRSFDAEVSLDKEKGLKFDTIKTPIKTKEVDQNQDQKQSAKKGKSRAA